MHVNRCFIINFSSHNFIIYNILLDFLLRELINWKFKIFMFFNIYILQYEKQTFRIIRLF